ncbi:MAG: hypothetical protein IH604_14890 [Burkholderiales bacterium]|nr:hypothetical protein [Burkholderiales bacterium]
MTRIHCAEFKFLLALAFTGLSNSALADLTVGVTLRTALENIKEMPANHGVFSFSASNHKELDRRAVVMVSVQSGTWKVLQ